ncbi:hypothetical protein CC78DRAFT_159501 [Lojkania enalia]|uniref:RING-type domain-containing protein n=1 Tax=Lojkania enalia TaxID=147567 RepID=A0A9P4N479_9PLEO|nr:hypothetical protein CC78DRAFT_159501 [Didymosphaeria enalia]
MADAAIDAKSALLSDELKEYALTLPTDVFPKAGNGNFFCASCNQLAFDPWKLMCCNRSICSSCHSKLLFPTTCPSCEHDPVEADMCTVNKSLRNTMRVWLDKRKKKDAKCALKTAKPPAEAVSATPDMQHAVDVSEKLVDSIEGGSSLEEVAGTQVTAAGNHVGQTDQQSGATVSPQLKTSISQDDESQRRGSVQLQNADKSSDPTSTIDDPNAAQNNMEGPAKGMYGDNGMMNMNGMSEQNMFSYGFNQNQGNFNGMGWNGMPMGNAGWNNMNPMGMFDMNGMNNMNMANGMYGGFGGNMGMPGMNDMAVMNMMNYGGSYGNGWQGQMNGGGFGNFNGYNQMGGYNQSGAQYPQMMNQFPKNNFQNQNRFPAPGGPFPQQKNNRQGSIGSVGAGAAFQQNTQSRPGSRAGPSQNVRRFSQRLSISPIRKPQTDIQVSKQRDNETPNGNAEGTPESKVESKHADASAEPAKEGKDDVDGKAELKFGLATEEQVPPEEKAQGADALTRTAGDSTLSHEQEGGLNQIQTVDSAEEITPPYDQSMINGAMPPDQGYPQGMMSNFSYQASNMNGPYGPGMGYNQSNFGSRSGFNPAYGAATVLTGEPRGLGVVGAPTGPRAMREGRPNTGFSSRANNARLNPQASATSTTPIQNVTPTSPPRKSRSSPERDDSLRTKDKSPSRSRSRSRPRARKEGGDHQGGTERSGTVEREEQRRYRDRSPTPGEDDYARRKDRHRHRSSRNGGHDDRNDIREDDHDDRYRDDREDRDEQESWVRSPSQDSKYRSSRRDKDRHRSSRSYRDRSREHRHRHRSRSRSPITEDKYEDDDYANGAEAPSEQSSRHKSKGEKEKYRDRDRDRSKDRDRDRDRRDRRDRGCDYDRDYEYEREKDRSREKNRDRKRSRRDRDADYEDDFDYDDKHRSSRRNSRKERSDRDRERDRERDRDTDRSSTKEPASATSAHPPSPPLNAPTGPAADSDFSIRGFSKSKTVKPPSTMPPPIGPRNFQPPTGPASQRDKERSREHRRRSSLGTSMPTTPTTPSTQDHYAAEREKNTRERERLDRDKVLSSLHARATSHSSRPSLSSKRSRDDFEDEQPADKPVDKPEDRLEDRKGDRGEKIAIPSGPASTGHRNKRRKSGDGDIANIFAKGLRKVAATKERRRGGVRTEGEVERELERVERERDGGRW